MKAYRILFAILLLLPVSALHAELEEHTLMSANIPFAFVVGNTRLPAGHYVIYSVEADHLWRLSSFRHGGNAFFRVSMDTLRRRSGLSQLTFHRYEKEYVLRQIDESQANTTAMLPAGKREQQLARDHRQPEIAMIEVQSGIRPE